MNHEEAMRLGLLHPSAEQVDAVAAAGLAVQELLCRFAGGDINLDRLAAELAAIPVVVLPIDDDLEVSLDYLNGPLSVVNRESLAGRLNRRYVDRVLAALLDAGWQV